MDCPNDQAPGPPVRSGVPERGRSTEYDAVRTRGAAADRRVGEGGTLPTERDAAHRPTGTARTGRHSYRIGHGPPRSQEFTVRPW